MDTKIWIEFKFTFVTRIKFLYQRLIIYFFESLTDFHRFSIRLIFNTDISDHLQKNHDTQYDDDENIIHN